MIYPPEFRTVANLTCNEEATKFSLQPAELPPKKLSQRTNIASVTAPNAFSPDTSRLAPNTPVELLSKDERPKKPLKAVTAVSLEKNHTNTATTNKYLQSCHGAEHTTSNATEGELRKVRTPSNAIKQLLPSKLAKKPVQQSNCAPDAAHDLRDSIQVNGAFSGAHGTGMRRFPGMPPGPPPGKVNLRILAYDFRRLPGRPPGRAPGVKNVATNAVLVFRFPGQPPGPCPGPRNKSKSAPTTKISCARIPRAVTNKPGAPAANKPLSGLPPLPPQPAPPDGFSGRRLPWHNLSENKLKGSIWEQLLLVDLEPDSTPTSDSLDFITDKDILDKNNGSDATGRVLNRLPRSLLHASGSRGTKISGNCKVEVDYNRLTDLFFEDVRKKEQEAKAAALVANKNLSASASAQRQQLENATRVLDAKRRHNLEICLKGLGLLEDITPLTNMVCLLRGLGHDDETLEDSGMVDRNTMPNTHRCGPTGGMNEASLEIVLSLYPSVDEERSLQEYYTKGVTNFAKAERFLFRLLSIPNFKQRAECCIVRLRFVSEAEALRQRVARLANCVVAVEESVLEGALRRLLALILRTGNYLNHGSRKGAARGFALDSLVHLKTLKSIDGSTTLLRYLVELIEAQAPDIIVQLREVFSLCNAAADITFDDSALLLHKLESSVVKVSGCVATTFADDQRAIEVFGSFAHNALTRINAMAAVLEDTEARLIRLASLFAEKPTAKDGVDIIKKFARLGKDFIAAHTETREKRQRLKDQLVRSKGKISSIRKLVTAGNNNSTVSVRRPSTRQHQQHRSSRHSSVSTTAIPPPVPQTAGKIAVTNESLTLSGHVRHTSVEAPPSTGFELVSRESNTGKPDLPGCYNYAPQINYNQRVPSATSSTTTIASRAAVLSGSLGSHSSSATSVVPSAMTSSGLSVPKLDITRLHTEDSHGTLLNKAVVTDSTLVRPSSENTEILYEGAAVERFPKNRGNSSHGVVRANRNNRYLRPSKLAPEQFVSELNNQVLSASESRTVSRMNSSGPCSSRPVSSRPPTGSFRAMASNLAAVFPFRRFSIPREGGQPPDSGDITCVTAREDIVTERRDYAAYPVKDIPRLCISGQTVTGADDEELFVSGISSAAPTMEDLHFRDCSTMQAFADQDGRLSLKIPKTNNIGSPRRDSNSATRAAFLNQRHPLPLPSNDFKQIYESVPITPTSKSGMASFHDNGFAELKSAGDSPAYKRSISMLAHQSTVQSNASLSLYTGVPHPSSAVQGTCDKTPIAHQATSQQYLGRSSSGGSRNGNYSIRRVSTGHRPPNLMRDDGTERWSSEAKKRSPSVGPGVSLNSDYRGSSGRHLPITPILRSDCTTAAQSRLSYGNSDRDCPQLEPRTSIGKWPMQSQLTILDDMSYSVSTSHASSQETNQLRGKPLVANLVRNGNTKSTSNFGGRAWGKRVANVVGHLRGPRRGRTSETSLRQVPDDAECPCDQMSSGQVEWERSFGLNPGGYCDGMPYRNAAISPNTTLQGAARAAEKERRASETERCWDRTTLPRQQSRHVKNRSQARTTRCSKNETEQSQNGCSSGSDNGRSRGGCVGTKSRAPKIHLSAIFHKARHKNSAANVNDFTNRSNSAFESQIGDCLLRNQGGKNINKLA